MHNVNNVLDQHNIGVSPHLKTHVGVLNYSPPSPASSLSSESLDGDINSPGPCSPASAAARLHGSNDGDDHFCTPKKSLADSGVLGRIRVKLGTPGVLCEMHALSTEQRANVDTAKLFKNRFLLSTSVHKLPLSHAAKTPASYRHLVGLTTSTLKCTDVFTNAEYGCKVINEPFPKVQRAYYDIKCAGELARSSLYGHTLIRDVHEIVPADKSRSYLVIAPPKAEEGAEGVFEDLHTYMRQCRRLCDKEAKALFHQIAETVLLCHKNGIILRDLKLKRFFFIDQARTKLQYESLEGSMILDNPADDTLTDKIGCPLYTAPELLCPLPNYKGKPADMWSLGVILYTLLVGQYPFYERPNCNLITMIRHTTLQIPSIITRPARWLLQLLLSKDYTERLKADEVFITPWVRDQAKPYYAQVPEDISFFADDAEMEYDDSELVNANVLEAQSSTTTTTNEMETQQPMHYLKDCPEGNSNTDNVVPAIPQLHQQDYLTADCDTSNTQPIDYSLRAAANGSSSSPITIDLDSDEEMS